jgi:hypothetical protein
MNLGAFLATWAKARPACPKLNHPDTQGCIFCGHAPAPQGKPVRHGDLGPGTSVRLSTGRRA